MTSTRDLGIVPNYKSQKCGLVERFDAELARLLEFAAGLGAGDYIARLLADRPRAPPTETLELLVRTTLLQIAVDALRQARERVPQARARFETEKERYKIRAVEPDLGPTGIVPATKGAYTDHPQIRVEGSEVEARALARAVKELSVLHRNLVWTRVQVYSAQPELSQEAAGGKSGRDDASTPIPDPAGEERISQAEKAFLAFLKNPNGHRIAADVFALLKGTNETVGLIGRRSYQEIMDSEEITTEIWVKTHVYLRDTLDALEHILPEKDEDYPLEALNERTGVSLDALSVPRPPRSIDSPELRAAYWAAQRVHALGYEPFNDESVLLFLVEQAAREMRAASASPPSSAASPSGSPLATLFTHRVLAELLMARDTSDDIIRRAQQQEAASDESLNRVVGVVGLLGLLFPPAHIASASVGVLLLLGSVIASIRDVETQQRVLSARGIGSLLGSNEAAYAEALVSKPSIASALLPLVGELLAYELFGSLGREFAVGLAVLTDLRAIAPSPEEIERLLIDEE